MDLLLLLAVALLHLSVSGASNDRCPYIVHQTNHYVETYEEVCYMFVNEEKYWTKALDYCLGLGGDMLEIDNEATMLFIRTVLNSKDLGWDRNGVWLGAHDRHKEGHWQWASGRPMKYSYWEPGQPKSFIFPGISLEDCGCMKRSDNWRWHDYPCETLDWKYNFVCQWRMIPTTTTSTTASTTVTTKTTPVMRLTSIETEKANTVKSSYGVAGNDSKISVQVDRFALHTVDVKQDDDTIYTAYKKVGGSDHHTGTVDTENDKGVLIAYVLGTLFLIVLLLALVFFLYRRRQRKKPHGEDESPQFENLSYAQLRQAEINDNAANMACFSPNQMSSIYEEVHKPVNHGVNYYANIPTTGACSGEVRQAKITNLEAAAKENNSTCEKVVEKPAVNIVNNQLYDVDESQSPQDRKKTEDHVYEDLP